MKRVILFIALLVASACSYGQSIYDPALTCKYEFAQPPVVQFTITCAPAMGPGIPVQPPPPPPPVDKPTPPAADPCVAYKGNFLLYSYCLQGAVKPAPTGNSSSSDLPTTGFSLIHKGRPLTNYLTAGVPYHYSIPTYAGEQVTVTILEVAGTPDSMFTTSSIRGPTGAVLSGPSTFMRHGSHVLYSPGGMLTLDLTATVSAPLGVQRN